MKLFLVGGFLGSGKTTAIQRASMQLMGENVKVAVVTNDQGVELVDSKFIQKYDIPSREVTDGCFCCNYEDLDHSIQSLLDEEDPDIVFAESVGSCTDLVSTIVNPLEKFYPEREVFVSIFVDARILPVLIKESSYFFDEQVHYIYKKQLEEADLMVINKIDLLSEAELSEVKHLVGDRFADKEILYQNSLSDSDIKGWLNILMGHLPVRQREPLQIDYDTYGEGEAKLGWLDAELGILTEEPNAMSAGYTLINSIFRSIREEKFPIGHLKFMIGDDLHQQKISFTQGDDSQPDFEPQAFETNRITLLINARVQTHPARLTNIVRHAIRQTDGVITEKKLSAFRPGYPRPTYRF